jgi:dipeptidase D
VVVRDRAAFVEAVEQEVAGIKAEYRHTEPDMQFEIAGGSVSGPVWSQGLGERVLLLLNGLPHGVMAMSHDLEGLVETSINLAAVSEDIEDGAGVGILLSVRSSVGSALRAHRRRLRTFADLVGAQVEENEGYPAWRPNPDSALLARFQKVHERVAGKEAELAAVHAGLECGVIGEKFPGMDMISFGPQIEGAHSPDERVKVDTVGPFYRLLTETLAELARG